jgi:histidine phosphotransfer protein HptB
MSYYYTLPLVIETELDQARRSLGHGLLRILGYFQEDGAKSISLVEQAMAVGNAAAMVIPAHTLKGESRQFGAKRLGDLAEVIEMAARRCVEQHSLPDEVASEVAMLRGCFHETLAILLPGGSTSPASHPLHFQSPVQAAAVPRPSSLAAGPRTFGRRIG